MLYFLSLLFASACLSLRARPSSRRRLSAKPYWDCPSSRCWHAGCLPSSACPKSPIAHSDGCQRELTDAQVPRGDGDSSSKGDNGTGSSGSGLPTTPQPEATTVCFPTAALVATASLTALSHVSLSYALLRSRVQPHPRLEAHVCRRHALQDVFGFLQTLICSGHVLQVDQAEASSPMAPLMEEGPTTDAAVDVTDSVGPADQPCTPATDGAAVPEDAVKTTRLRGRLSVDIALTSNDATCAPSHTVAEHCSLASRNSCAAGR